MLFNNFRLLITTALGLMVFTFSHAQSEPDVEGVQKPLWEAGLAGFGLTGPAYPGADDYLGRGLVLPWFIYRGPVWRAAGGTVGARVAKMHLQNLTLDSAVHCALPATTSKCEAVCLN